MLVMASLRIPMVYQAGRRHSLRSAAVDPSRCVMPDAPRSSRPAESGGLGRLRVAPCAAGAHLVERQKLVGLDTHWIKG